MSTTYETVMSFLGNTEHEEIVRIVASPGALAAALSRPSLETASLTPDTSGAWAAATDDGQMYDRAERMMTVLRSENPQTWTEFKRIVRELTPGDNVAAMLERHDQLEDYLNPPSDQR